jgi:hypothetical protein
MNYFYISQTDAYKLDKFEHKYILTSDAIFTRELTETEITAFNIPIYFNNITFTPDSIRIDGSTSGTIIFRR